MKILCVIDSLESGGAQRQIVELAIGFKKNNHLVNFLTYHDNNFYKDILISAEIPVTVIVEPNYIMRLWKMRKFIRNNKYDNVLSFLEAANFICEIAGLPYRKWNLIVGERSANPNFKKSLRSIIFRWFHLLSDYVVANSNSNMDIVRSINPFLPENKCKVIFNAVDLNLWQPSSIYNTIKNEKLEILIAARHQAIKNFKGMVAGLQMLTEKEKSKIHITWYGDNSNDNSLQNAIDIIKLQNLESIITLHQATHFILEKIQTSDVIALFSYYEGFPNTICEGMACAKPIIASDVSDLNLFILNNVNGFLCNPNSKESIASAFRNILSKSNEDRIRMGQNNRRKAVELFNKEVIIQSYLELFMK